MTKASLRLLAVALLATLFAGVAAATAQYYYAPTRARFTFDSQPRGATVAIDGKPCGTTPLEVVLTYRYWNPNLAKSKQQLTRAERDESARKSTRFEVCFSMEGYAPTTVVWTSAEYIAEEELSCVLQPVDASVR